MKKTKGEYTGRDYTQDYKRMRCRKKPDGSINKNSFTLDIRISETESVTKTITLPATSAYCSQWDDRRKKLENDIINGIANADAKYLLGKHIEKLVPLSGDSKTIKVRFEDYMKEQETTNQREIKAGVIRVQRNVINNQLIPRFGEMYLSDLTMASLKDWIKEDCPTNVQRTIDNKIGLIHNIILIAIDNDELSYDILAHRNPKAICKSEYVKNAFSSGERDAILNQDMPDHLKNMITFWLFSGLRSAEIFGLTWAKFNKLKNTITVDRQLHDKGIWELSPKTVAGNRKFILLNQAREALLKQELITKLNRIDNPDSLIFMDMENCKFWASKRFKLRFKKILEDAGVEYRRPYTMRHSFATMILALEGRDKLPELSRMLGHESVTTTEQLYVDNKVRWVESDWSKTNAFFAEQGTTT